MLFPACFIVALGFGSAPQDVVSAPAGNVQTEAAHLLVKRGSLVPLHPARVIVRVRNIGAMPLEIASIAVEGLGEDLRPTVSLVTETGRIPVEDRRIPPRLADTPDGDVVIEAQLSGSGSQFPQIIPATIRFADGGTLIVELKLTLPIEAAPAERRTPVAPPVIIQGPPRSGN